MIDGDDDNVFNFNPRNEREERDLKLIRDEGLRLLSAFKKIGDPATRELLTGLAEALAKQSG